MDELLPQLLSFPPHPQPAQKISDVDYDRQIKALVKLLNGTNAGRLIKGVPGGGDLLDILDPAIQSLPYLYTLLAHIYYNQDGKQTGTTISKAFTPGGLLWQKMADFFERFDPVQVRYAGNEWLRLVETVARAAEAAQSPAAALIPIRTAMLRLDPSLSCFTSTHTLFAYFCLRTKAFQVALPVLDKDIYHFPCSPDKYAYLPLPCAHHDTSSTYITTTSGLTSKPSYRDHLTYFLYGAMLYLGVKDWERALLFLEVVIMSPTSNNASMIQVEAYKKWLLVGLLLKGRGLPLPKTTSPPAAKLLRSLAKPYDTLVAVFKDGDGERLHAEVQAAQQIFQNDCNMGLVIQVLGAFRRFLIQRLERIYAAVPISVVAQKTSPQPDNVAETEAYVTSLIASGQLNAALEPAKDPSQGSMLRFAISSHDGRLAHNEAHHLDELTKQITRFAELDVHVKGAERRLELTKEYLDHTRKVRKGKDSDNSIFASTYPTDGVEEDVFADM